MTCKDIVATITAYLEGALPEADRARFEAHLAECDFCVDYVAQMRATVARLGEPDAGLSGGTRAAILAAFRDSRG